MITRQNLFPMLFYEKSKFHGSKGKMNYRIEKYIEKKETPEGEQTEEKSFRLTVWEGPECFDATKKEKTVTHYPYSDEGMDEIVKVLNQL